MLRMCCQWILLAGMGTGLWPGCLPAQEENRQKRDPPRAIIQGPSQAIAGELIVLDASTSEDAERYRWSIAPELKGRRQLIESDGGRRCQVASYGGRYVVTLAVSNSEGIDLLTWELVVAGPSPCPPPIPEPAPTPVDPSPVPEPTPQPVPEPMPVPTPEPVQPLDPGRFSLAPEVFRIASQATSVSRRDDCRRLATECRRIAAAEWAGMTPMAQELVNVLNSLPAGWGALQSRVRDSIAGLYAQGLIQNKGDIASLLLELAPAFDRAALLP